MSGQQPKSGSTSAQEKQELRAEGGSSAGKNPTWKYIDVGKLPTNYQIYSKEQFGSGQASSTTEDTKLDEANFAQKTEKWPVLSAGGLKNPKEATKEHAQERSGGSGNT